MSSDKPKPIYRTELDLAEDEFFAQFEEKDEKPSVIDLTKAPSVSKPLSGSIFNFIKPHDVRAVTSAMNDIFTKDSAPPPIMTPSVSEPLFSNSSSSTSNHKILKRSISSHQQPDDQASKVKKLDNNNEDFIEKNELDNLEEALFAEYMAQEQDDDDQEEEDDEDDEDDEADEDDGQITCKPCLTETKPRTTDNDAKQYAFNMPFMFIGDCNSECKYGGTCVEQTTIKDMRSMVNAFWDEYECDAPSAATRRIKILAILRSAYRPNTDEFEFYAGCKEKNNRVVCEAAFLIMLGISNSPQASKAPGQWRRLKKYVREGKDLAGIKYCSNANEEDTKNLKKEKKEVKKNNAVTFIQWFSKEFGDTIPGAEGK